MKWLTECNVTKLLSLGITLMGVIHEAATFTPLIEKSLAILPKEIQNAFTYFSLICGLFLVVCGATTLMLSEIKTKSSFLQELYAFIIIMLVADGVLSVSFMPYNPFAWITFALTTLLLCINYKSIYKQ